MDSLQPKGKHVEHQERTSERGDVCREFTRRFELPEDVDKVAYKMSNDHGQLTIFGLRKPADMSEDSV